MSKEKSSAVSTKDLKKVMKTKAAQMGTISTGFIGGHVLYGAVPQEYKTGVKGIMASLLLVLIGGFAAVKSTNEHLQNVGVGVAVYGLMKSATNTINLSADGSGNATNGVGALPEGMRNALSKIFPNLSGADDIEIYPPGTQIEAIDTEYEFLNGAENEVEEYRLADLGNGASPSDTDLYMPTTSGVAGIHLA